MVGWAVRAVRVSGRNEKAERAGSGETGGSGELHR